MESRFTSLLSTNYVPSNDELNEIQQLLVDPVDQLNQLDAEIERLQNTINKISSKREKLHDDILRHRNLMAPIRRIPEELLQHIFFHSLPVDHNPVMSCHEAPLLLGRVCSHWRNVSLSTPLLWSGIHIVIPGNMLPMPDQVIPETLDQNRDIYEAVEAWLNRSGGLPLSISLFQAPYPYTPPEFVELLISALIQFSSRWRNISIIASPPSDSQLFSLSPNMLPLLEKISFHAMHNSSPFTEFLPLDIFRAPRLRVMSSYFLGTIPGGMKWSQLSSLSLQSCGHGEGALTPSKAIGILHESPNLIHCELNFMGGWGNTVPFDDHRVVTMPLLKSLSIREGIHPLEPFYELLLLPVLTDLEFAASSHAQHLNTLGVTERRSICALLSRIDSLKELTLSALDLTHDIVISCLQDSPSITRLSILSPQPADAWPFYGDVLSPFNDEVAILLTPTKGQPVLCPLLKILECSPCGVSDDSLLALIEQRTTHASAYNIQPLERVELVLHQQSKTDVLSMLPPGILADTVITLEYRTFPVPRRIITPWGGLEKPGRLQIPPIVYRHLSY